MLQKWTVRITWLMPFILVYFFAAYLTPFSWYVDVKPYEAVEPICVGEDTITYYSERTPRWGIQGDTWGQVIKFYNQEVIETTIIRGSVTNPIGFAYEEGTSEATYATRWDEPFETPGTYGANEWVNIYPLPFVKITKFNKGEDAKFEVIVCDQ